MYDNSRKTEFKEIMIGKKIMNFPCKDEFHEGSDGTGIG